MSDENRNKYTFYPIQTKSLYDFYKLHESTLWQMEKIDYAADLPDLARLTKDELYFITHVLAFFAASDGIVNENLAIRFYKDVELIDARAFYTIQMYQESVHSETYSMLIDTYVKDEAEKNKLFNAIETISTIKRKSDWALKWIDSQDSFAKRLIAFAIVEGVFFSGSFCAIYWFRKRGLLANGLGVANDYISRDETMHWHFAAALYREMGLKVSQAEFEQILREAVEIECEYVTDALPVSLIGMSAPSMCQYIRHVADMVSTHFGFNKVYGDQNPFDFMKLMALDGQTNFFEKRVTSYKKSQEVKKVSFDEDF